VGRDDVALSPDGTRLALIVRYYTPLSPLGEPLSANAPKDGYELVTFDTDGDQRRTIVPMTGETALSNLKWAPDGRDLAFARAPFTDCGNRHGEHPDCTYTVELVRADGSAPARVIAHIGSPFGGGVPPYALSPDGRRLAFAAPGSFVLTVARLDGSDRRTLSRVAAWVSNWSPDGRKILYAAGRRTGPELLVLYRWRIITVGSKRNVGFPDGAWVTTWSPNGRQLLGFDRRGLLLYRPDGRVARRIPGTKRYVLGGAVWNGGRRL
jgi:Tol biopolymer transport system component